MNVGIALYGVGTVGGGLVEILEARGEEIQERHGIGLRVRHAVVRDVARARDVALNGARLTSDWRAPLADPEVAVVVEAMGGLDPARDVVWQALEAGRAVVTANKALISAEGEALERLAAATGGTLRYEAAVGGAIPILHALRGALVANRITRVRGILNGTTNYILTRMDEGGLPLDVALELARRLGFAEADATADVSGLDSAQKLSILARHAFGRWIPVEQAAVEGIAAVSPAALERARRSGARIKLVAEAERDDAGNVSIRVAPTPVPDHDPLALVRDEANAVVLEGDFAGPLMFIGRGAGRRATGSAVFADLVDVALARPVGAIGS